MLYCENCGLIEKTQIKEQELELQVKDTTIKLKVQVKVCAKCGEEIFDEELYDKNLNLFYNEYKKQKNLLLPNKIKEIREKIGISQTTFSKLLGFGEKTITRYENGAIQDYSHDNLMKLMDSTENLKKIWKSRKNFLTSSENRKIKDYIEKEENKLDMKFNYNPNKFIYTSNISNCYNERAKSYAS